MNIFALHTKPSIAAKMQCDKHVVKMTVETAQILSMAIRAKGLKHRSLYKQTKTHKNHPVVKWAGMNQSNFDWTVQLGLELAKEYTFRYGKIHKSEKVIKLASLYTTYFNPGRRTNFVQCIPLQYQQKSAIKAYREFYINNKITFAKWKKRPIPAWFKK